MEPTTSGWLDQRRSRSDNQVPYPYVPYVTGETKDFLRFKIAVGAVPILKLL